jgi:transmembrane sensor
MRYNEEDIKKLALDEVAGIITDSDRAYLHRAIAEDSDAERIYRDTMRMFDNASVQQAMQTGAVHQYERFVKASGKQTRIRRMATTSAAAATVALMVGAFFFFRLNNQQQIVSARKQSIELQLPGGKSYNLSDSATNIGIAGIQTSAGKKSMSVSAASELSEEWAVLTVPEGKDYHVMLSDGSNVWLNSATTLRFPLKFGKTREVEVTGEAYFEVERSAEKPFTVRTGQTVVQVLGTAFNVNSYAADRIALVNGSVRIKSGADSLLLKPGFEAIAADKLKVVTFEANDVLAWRQGIHVFTGARMDEIYAVIKRMYGVELVVDNENAKQALFTGSLDRKQPLPAFLEVLKYSRYINGFYYSKDSVVHIQ